MVDRDLPASIPGVGRQRWNHNIHYGLQLLDLVPAGATDALEVGCGEGWLVGELTGRVSNVVGLDPDEESISAARSHHAVGGVGYVQADLLNHPFRPASFDFISCVSGLHHMDEEVGLVRMIDLLRPGGTVAIVGLARARLPYDLPWELAGAVATRARREVDDPRIVNVEADVFDWVPEHRHDLVFFGMWLSHVPPPAFERFWEKVKSCLAPGGRVVFVDEDHRASGVVDDPRLVEGVPVVRRVLADGREYDVVKVFWNVEELEDRLGRLGWDIRVARLGDMLLYGDSGG
ncbi:MAG TPA: class I SAM-dependent methyltransferase [Acidimicrobiales bacterium]|nr:class I SAM-dependent methyltransferase [Acidimicrobiales bacterium]